MKSGKKRRKVQVPSKELTPEAGDLKIDGSMLEGGGQILRNAAALSAISRTRILVDNIRHNRDKPGLRPQHLSGLQLIEQVSGGQLSGGAVGSQRMRLAPGSLHCADYTADTKTAGSCVLLAQAVVPCLLLAAPSADGATVSHVCLRGGTDAAMAPPVGYMQLVLLPVLRRHLGTAIELSLTRRGFFPKGGGEVHLTVPALPAGASLPPLNLVDRGDVCSISIQAFSAGRVAPSVADRLAAAAHKEVKAQLGRSGVDRRIPLEVQVVHETPETAFGDGCGVVLVAETTTGCFLGSSGLGERGVPAEDIGLCAAEKLMAVIESRACADQWLQDQLIIFMALSSGSSRMLVEPPTLHTQTAVEIAQQLTAAKFSIEQLPAGAVGAGLWKISCTGAELKAGQQL